MSDLWLRVKKIITPLCLKEKRLTGKRSRENKARLLLTTSKPILFTLTNQ